jgi:hypothetical protein
LLCVNYMHGICLHNARPCGPCGPCGQAYYGHHEVLRVLLRADRELGMASDPEGRTAIHWTTKHQSTKCLDLMLKVCPPSIINVQDSEKVRASTCQPLIVPCVLRLPRTSTGYTPPVGSKQAAQPNVSGWVVGSVWPCPESNPTVQSGRLTTCRLAV